MQAAHAAFLEIFDYSAQAADLERRGLETSDTQLLAQAQGPLQGAAEAMDRWKSEMQPWVAILEPLLKLPE